MVLFVVPRLAEQKTIDSEVNVTEVYVIETECSMNMKTSMKLYIETLNEAIYTYILKFSDKDVIISYGRVVE